MYSYFGDLRRTGILNVIKIYYIALFALKHNMNFRNEANVTVVKEDIGQWVQTISDGLPWPMVHVFLPALVAIYIQNVWICLSLIYLFESVEFLFSEFPGAEYWFEDSYADSLVSDILMGVLGFWAASGFQNIISETSSWYACLQPITTSPKWYQKWSGLIHVVLAATSTLIITAGDHIPIFYQYAIFGVLYVMVALLFGHYKWALCSLLGIVLISTLALLFEYTVLMCLSVVCLAKVIDLSIVKQKIEQSEEQNDGLLRQIDKEEVPDRLEYKLYF